MTPPRRQRMTASMRNCRRMMAGFAPIAFRRPISRVRSETETSMMFMMPTPPTRSEILTMQEAMPMMTLAMVLNCSTIFSGVFVLKVLGSPGLMLRVCLRKNSICAAASAVFSGVNAVALTRK